VEHWQLPEETIKKGTGDCDDKAILFAYLVYLEFGIKVDFSIQEEHIACWYDGKYYDPTNYLWVDNYHTAMPEKCKTPFDTIMARAGFTVW
jgi:hypothetical protein